MKDKIFLDTNILIYSFDFSNPTKQKIAKELINSLCGNSIDYLISTQVVSEFCSVVIKKFKEILSENDLKRFVSSLPQEQIAFIDQSTIIKSLHIKYKYGFSYWDSMIIVTAIQSGCDVLYSEDLSDGQVIENLRIVNPFKNL